MGYKRKLEDKRRKRRLYENQSKGYPMPVYVKETRSGKKTYLKRFWKSEGRKSQWAWCKKHSHKKCRLYLKKNGVYTKKAYDLWCAVW